MRFYKDNWKSSITAAVSAIDTSIELDTALEMPAGSYAIVTLQNKDASKFEFVKVTAVSGSTVTVQRSQDGTLAQSFDAGECIALIAMTVSSLLEPTEKSVTVTSGAISIKNGTIQHLKLAGDAAITFDDLKSGQSLLLNIDPSGFSATFAQVVRWYGKPMPLAANKRNALVISNEAGFVTGYNVGEEL